MADYLETLGTYYDEKVKFLSDLISDKRDLLKCNGCDDSEKVFDESDVNRFIFSCGETKGKCGTQITIEFPKYICYEKELQNLREKINEGINWSVISKYLDVDDELKRQEEKRDKCLLAIKYIEDLFNEKNMDDKKSHIQKFYDSRIEKMRLSKDLQKSLNKETDESKKSIIRKDYVLNQKKMFQETLEFKELLKSINPYLQTELPKVTISNENYKENIMKKRKKKTKEDKKDKEDKEDKKVKKIKKEDKKKDKKPKKKKDSPKSPRHNLSEFKKDLRVSWNAKGQDNFGTIIEDPSDNRISIKDDNGKKKKIPYTRLTIVKDKKEEVEKEEVKEENSFEPEPQKESDKKEDKEEDLKKVEGFDIPNNTDLMKPQSIKDLKEGLKIIAYYEGQKFQGYIGKIDKRMKKMVNVVLYHSEGGEIQVKIPISDIIHVIL